jgi:hypothetical protein
MNTYLEGKVEALPGEDRHIDWGMLNRSHPASHPLLILLPADMNYSASQYKSNDYGSLK